MRCKSLWDSGKVWDGERKLMGPDLYGNSYIQFHYAIPCIQTDPKHRSRKGMSLLISLPNLSTQLKQLQNKFDSVTCYNIKLNGSLDTIQNEYNQNLKLLN